MFGLSALILLASSAIAAEVCFVPSFEKFTFKSDPDQKTEGDKEILCYKVEFSEKPTDAELYKDVECDKEYYVLTGQLLEGSYNDFRFPNVAFKPRMVPDKEQYEVDGTKGKLRALAVKPQKVELNKLVEFEGDWCVQKVGKFDNQDPFKLLRFVPSKDLDDSILEFKLPKEESDSNPDNNSNNNNNDSSNNNNNNNNSSNNNNNNNSSNSSNQGGGVGVVRVCEGTNINCGVSTQSNSPTSQSSSQALATTTGEGRVIIVSTSSGTTSTSTVSIIG